MAGQDISFESMAQASARGRRHRPRTIRTSQTSAPSSRSGNQGFVFARMKPRDERKLSVDEIIEDLRPEARRRSRAS